MIARVRERNRELYERAKKSVPLNPNGSVDGPAVRRALSRIIPFDEDALRDRQAAAMIDDLCRDNPEEADGQLHFADFGTWDCHPERLVRSADGCLIENCNAPREFKLAEAQRSESHADDARASSRRKRHEYDVLNEWFIKQSAAGAKPETLTWGACYKALGIHEPKAKTESAKS